MPLKPAAEYLFSDQLIFTEGPVFITYSTEEKYTYVKIYRYPNLHLHTSMFHSSISKSDICITLNKETYDLEIFNKQHKEEHIYSVSDLMELFEEPLQERGVSVRSDAQSKGKCTPAVYIHGQKVFTIGHGDAEGFYYCAQEMKLYTYIPESSAIIEYLLFSVERIYPRGFCFLYPDRALVYLPERKYTLSIEYAPSSIISLFYDKKALRHVLSFHDLIMYRNQFKKYPDGFTPSRIWAKHAYTYLFSATTGQLLVLNSSFEIEFDMTAANVFVTEEHVFISKKENTIAHYTKTFKFAFILPGLILSKGVVAIEVVQEKVIIFSQENIVKQTTPLFSLFITEVNISTKEIKKLTAIPHKGMETQCINQITDFTLEEKVEKPYITTGIQVTSAAKKNSLYLVFGVSSSSVFIFWEHGMVVVPLVRIERPFSYAESSKKQAAESAGLPFWIDPDTGTLYTVKENLVKESIFPILLLLCLSKALPFSLVFGLFSETPEYKTSVERALFYFLHNEEIEMAIDLIDAVKTHAMGTYEEIVSTMVRLLDERNTCKLYSLIDRTEVRQFLCADSLSRLLVQDFSLFERFLDSTIAQRKEHLIYHFIEFVSKVEDADLHAQILHNLLKHTMLYLSGMLLSKIENLPVSGKIDSESLVVAYRKTNSIIEQIKDVQNPADVIQDIFTGKDSLLTSMVAEKLYMLESIP
ncbi:uncharacterized protein NESG_00184 [Nematocida ausubeli]|uniref:Uncharacterized protein n=1 Tax=Nematocida ausubeli (strain ATCC PRA-371 / ERTm2) TaxID=1913371 RepID=A0A086J4P1_NEMA1|nr:uncharacterized protein NESG_00184 [Nematocida ausubeli]KFG27109.1 hypothetical protein NESG_00184 [Nematocida ausubeli]